MPRARLLGLVVLFLVLTIVTTYPQVTGIGTLVPYHPDPYFSMWRLGWIAHQTPSHWMQFFEGNIFFPAPHTLAYSDATLLPGIIAAPFFWAGVSAVTIYNLALLSAMMASGIAAALLVRRLTGSDLAGVVSGTIYAFSPPRFDHYAHLEMQVVHWLPLVLLSVHRTIERGRFRDAVMLGALVAAQTLSNIYATLFLAAYAVAFVPVLLLLPSASGGRLRAFALWTAAAAIAVALIAPYAAGYVRAQRVVGTRTLDDVRHYGATTWSYRSTPPTNRLFGREGSRPSSDERYLFPGYTALLLAGIGLFCGRDNRRFAYLAGLAIAFELSRGLNGVVYPWAFEHVYAFRALRVPSRISLLVMLSLAVLAGYGMHWMLSLAATARRRAIAAAVVTTALIIEYASAPVLTAAPPVSRIDRWLARRPPSVIVELPLASHRGGSSLDWLYMYEGIEHRQRMLNGYSGFAPNSYYEMLDRMSGFPDDRSMALLRERQVNLVVLRGEHYRQEEWDPLIAAARARNDLSLVTILPFGDRFQAVFSVNK